MKANDQILDASANPAPSDKARAVKAGKAIRKSTSPAKKASPAPVKKASSAKKASPAKKASRTAAKRSRREQQSALSGYSDNAARFIGRARAALGKAYTWVGETGSALPKNARQIGLPTQKSSQALIDGKPLIVGAVGLGLGIALGAAAALSHSAAPTKRPMKKSSRRK